MTRPTKCAILGRECSWLLKLCDAEDLPAMTGSLVKGLALGLSCSCDHVTSRMFITACKAVNYRVILTQLVTF